MNHDDDAKLEAVRARFDDCLLQALEEYKSRGIPAAEIASQWLFRDAIYRFYDTDEVELATEDDALLNRIIDPEAAGIRWPSELKHWRTAVQMKRRMRQRKAQADTNHDQDGNSLS